MYRLQQQFGEQIDFIRLDVDKSETKETMNRLGMRGRSQYMLLDANQNMIRLWRGVLHEQTMATELTAELNKLGIATN